MKFTQLAVVCAVAGTLAACGGGSSSPAVDVPVQSTSRTLDGVAAKGLIKNGIVNVYAYKDGVKSATPLVTARTSSVDGSYTVNLGSNIGLFTVEVSADDKTTMADEVGGKDIAMPVGMTMRSLIQLETTAGTSIKGYVTPFTDMVVNAASKASGGLTSANVASAQTGVTTMLGFNPLTTKPVMINGVGAATATDASEILQSIHLAALSKLANDSSNDFACEGSVSAKIACVLTATTAKVELKDGNISIPLAAQVAIHHAAELVTADKAINKTTKLNLDGVASFTQAKITVPVVGTVEKTPIAATKAMFASLRTNANALQASLKNANPADVMQADFDKAIAPLDQDLADWLLMSERGITLFNSYKAASNSGAINQTVTQNGRAVGYCFLATDIDSKINVISGSPAANVFCRLEKKPVTGTQVDLSRTATAATAPTQTVDTHKSRQQFTKTIQLSPDAVTPSSFGYKARTRMETAYYNRDISGNITYLVIDDAKTTIGAAGTGTVAYDQTGSTINSITIAGDMPARTDAMGGKITDKETWNVNYARTPELTGSIVKYALSGEIVSYLGAAKFGSVSLLPGSFLRAIPDAGGDINGNGLKEVNLAVTVTGVDSKVTGTLALNNFVSDKSSNYIPTDMKFTGSLNNGSTEFFNGVLTAKVVNFADVDSSLPNSVSNAMLGNASFVGILRIKDRPDLKLSLSVSHTAFDTNLFTAQYEDGSNTLLLSGSDHPKVINIASADGVSVQLKDGIDTADVMKNGSKVATFSRKTNLITYTDLTFESLK